MRLIQHKKEAYWFYRFLSLGLRPLGQPAVLDAGDAARALDAARLDARGLEVLDAGAGTGFTTEGIVERVDADARDDARPEPAPARPRATQAGARGVRKLLGDAEALPFETDASTATSRPASMSTGRTRSAGSPRPIGCSSPAARRS